MGIFSSILDKLRGHSRNEQQSAGQPGQAPRQQAQYAPAGTQAGTTASHGGQAGGASIQNVDVDAVLKDLAAKKGGGGNYRESIVDLLKLLDLDSSLEARKQLASELGVNAGAHGSAEQNIALQKAVMRKLAENGGKVPDSLRD
jgi:Domain of unknown function (DUF3597)